MSYQISNTGCKENLAAWFIITILAFFLWYRNQEYDRILSLLVFTFGLICLISYGIYSTMNLRQAENLFSIIIWLQAAILAISVWVFLKGKNGEGVGVSSVFAVVFSIFFVISIIFCLTGTGKEGNLGKTGDSIYWENNKFQVLYLIGLFGPLILLLNYYQWSDIGLYFLIFYLAFGVLSVTSLHHVSVSYLIIGFSFLAYIIGAFR